MQVGRNSPCPCGSGKKYKRCCLASGEFEQAGQSAPDLEQVLVAARTAVSLADMPRARRALEPLLATSRPTASVLELAYSIEMRERDFSRAGALMLQLLEQEPEDPARLANYATTLALSGELAAAAEVFEKAIEIDPELWSAYPNYANTLRDLGRSREAAKCYQRAFDSGVLDIATMSQILLTMHLFVFDEHEMLFNMHRRLGEALVGSCPTDAPTRESIATRDKIRVGYLSPRFSRQIVGYFFKPLFDHHDRDRFEIYLYSATEKQDDLTEYFSDNADHWRDVRAYSDAALREKIVDDEIDILVDLAGHAPENRMAAIACKPAPVQVSMIDYFDTTGVSAIDYYVTDHGSTPNDSPQLYQEELIFLDQPRLVYEAPPYAPPVRVRSPSEGGIVFGSFNRHHKIVPEVVQVWSGLLLQIPDSRLVLKSAAFADADVQAIFTARFEALGVEAQRLEFRGNSAHEYMLAEYADIDVALDTFPYNGGLTTCEALWMGTPVITLLGQRVISRQTSVMLEATGLRQFVANDAAEFSDIGRYWSENRDELNELRLRLREIMAQSKLTDGASYTADLEAQFRRIWHGVCSSD